MATIGLGGTTPTATAGIPADPYTAAAGLMGGAKDIYGGLGGTGLLTNINSYIDPYYQNVVDAALGRMRTERDMGLNLIGDQATQAGAFGGARHGIMEGQYMGEHDRSVGDLTARMASEAYRTGLDTSLADRNQQMQIAGGMAGLGGSYYNIGNNIADRQAGIGQQQQQLTQGLLSGSYQDWMGEMQHPYQMLDMLNALLAGDARRGAGTATKQSTPGLFDYLSLLTGMIGVNFAA